MKTLKKFNDIGGWLVFALSFIVYTLTVEETASFWDCGEFITVASRLQVPHPPGAPLYLLLGRLFSMFAFNDPLAIAFWVNMLSVTASAFTILFMFWTITFIARKVVSTDYNGEYSQDQVLSILGASLIGSLAYTFSDTFWFSAVEAEVYAMSSFFTAFVLWAMLKWDTITDKRQANKWIILICYMMGLSIGVHLLNLVMIPALALIYYFKESKEPKLTGMLISAGIGVVIIGIIQSGIITGLPSIAANVEILFVNSFGLGFGTGVLFSFIALVAALILGILYTIKKEKEVLNTIMLGITYIIIGYSSYAIIPIRSNFNPALDENNPEDAMSFVSYLKREQYGDRPLLYGPTYVARLTAIDRENGEKQYRKGEEDYVVYGKKPIYTYEKDKQMLLPRVYSTQDGHRSLYEGWMGLEPGEEPSFADNLRYMFVYQFGHMYTRYLLWNFVGREGDEKEAKSLTPFDNKSAKPSQITNNKAYNNFYAIPFILGLIGFFFHLMRDQKNALMMLLVFFFTGLGLVIYLNSPPVEPRERDYIYVGSFYAFAIWIGLSVIAIKDFLVKYASAKMSLSFALILTLIAPALMGFVGWDNHDRSNRYHSIDQARNTLASCEKNAILFTGGDNDTFPLWYVQEVEGFRTDVRVIVLSYFSTPWYINQMRRKVHESDSLNFTMSPKNYLEGINDQVIVDPIKKYNNAYLDLEKVIQGINMNGDPELPKNKAMAHSNPLLVPWGDKVFSRMPSGKLLVNVDSAKVAGMNILPKGKKPVSKMTFEIKKAGQDPETGKPTYHSSIFKSDLMILDFIATNKWKRPIYFNRTASMSTRLDVASYLYQEGMTYRLLPSPIDQSRVTRRETGEMNVDKTLENIKKFKTRGFDNPNNYHDEEYRKFASNTRDVYIRLAQELHNQGRDEEAEKILDECIASILDESVPYGTEVAGFVEVYNLLGKYEKAAKIADKVVQRTAETLQYIKKESPRSQFWTRFKQKDGFMLYSVIMTYKEASQNAQRELDIDAQAMKIKGGNAEGDLKGVVLPEGYQFLSEDEKQVLKEKVKIFEAKYKEYSSYYGLLQ